MSPEMVEQIIEQILASSATILAIFASYKKTARTSSKNFARQAILQMIMEDQMNWEMFGKLPRNYSIILEEYDKYHKNGGNGEITLRVEDYKEWYKQVETGRKTKKASA